jgi:hypothetical protein
MRLEFVARAYSLHCYTSQAPSMYLVFFSCVWLRQTLISVSLFSFLFALSWSLLAAPDSHEVKFRIDLPLSLLMGMKMVICPQGDLESAAQALDAPTHM